MAEEPVAATTLGLESPPAERPYLGGVSPQVLLDLHQDELRQLQSQFVRAVAFGAAAASAWLVVELRLPGSPLPFLLGYLTVTFAFRAAALGRRWWVLKHRDPVAAALAQAAQITRARAAAAERAARFAAHPARVTMTIAGGLVVIAILEFVAVGSTERAVAVAGLDKTKVAAGEWWRLLTAGFLHASALHLWANLSALVAFGRIVEAYSTRSRFLLAYLTAVIVGNLASCWLLPQVPSIGASGGILGIAAFLYALSRRRPSEVPSAFGTFALASMVLTGVVGLVGFRFIDNAAHAGGALAGFLVGWLTVPRELPKLDRSSSTYNDDRLLSILGVASAVVLIIAALVTGTKLFAQRPKAVTSARAELSAIGGGHFNLIIDNFRDVPLDAYTIDVYSAGTEVFRQWRDDRGFESKAIDTGPIPPHGRRVVALADGRQVFQPSVRFVAAAFADGTFEGSADEYEVIAQRRASVAADADYWIAVIDEARAKPPAEIAAFIDAKIGERASANAAARRPTYTGDVAWLLHLAVDTPDRFATDVGPERARFVKLRDELITSVR
jgi:membrane associated rhomboid family serine protease